MARNRKRAKERRARRPQPVVGRIEREEAEERPEAIRHAAPDVEIAEAQIALGRPDLIDESPADEDSDVAAETDEGTSPEAADDNELEYELESTPSPRGDGDGAARGRAGAASQRADAGGGRAEVAATAAPTPAPRGGIFSRLIGFLRGSWAELQRVQWPDRRQVMQATGVVIGFVIVAGVFLGVADTLSQHVVSYILNGHW